MDIQSYLDRIGSRGPLTHTAETLRDLQVAHLQTVPFENLSIHAHQPIVLDDESLFDKVVARRRGGFCYELNGLFAALLRALGFQVTMLSAAVARPDGTFGPDFDHMALQVNLEERWLARWLVDVGFGDSFRHPLRLDERGEQPEGAQAFRIAEDGGHLLLLRRDGPEKPWQPQYRFTLQPYEYPDYAGMCHFHQTSPESHFTRQTLCSLATPEGRITLSGRKLITTHGGERQEKNVESEDERAALLRELFGVTV
jgi:N-hydroxyarylamine O-acetyltransferase